MVTKSAGRDSKKLIIRAAVRQLLIFQGTCYWAFTLIKKLESLSNIYFKSCSQYIYPLPVERTDNKQVFYNIAILDDAIRKKKKVLFEYAEYHTDKEMHLKKR